MSPAKERAGTWIRVSTLMQDAQNQIPDIEGHCRARDYEIAKEYQLEGGSAFHGKQEKLIAEALADVRAGEITVLVAWASDRMERRGAEATLGLIREFREAGGRIEFVKEPFLGKEDGASELIGSVIGWGNKQESVRKSERQTMESENKANVGAPPKKLAYGYKRLPDGRQVPDELTAAIVREIFNRYAAGTGAYIIAADLNRRGIPTPRPGNAKTARPEWRADTVRRILKVATYAAIRTHQGKLHRLPDGVTPQWPPLVDLDLWWAVQERLETRKDESGKQYRSSNGPYMMASTALCWKCGGRMECIPSYNKKKVRNGQHYQCLNLGCGGTSIEQEALDQYVSDKMVLWCIDPKTYTYLTSGQSSEKAAAFRAKAREKQKEIDEAEEDYKSGVVPARLVGQRIERLERERNEAEQGARDAGMPSVLKDVIGPRAASKWARKTPQEKREIIRKVAEITVLYSGKGANQFQKMRVADRVAWRWLIGPDADKPAVIPQAREYATPRDRYRAALTEDPALARLNHKAISVKLGTSADTIKFACRSLVADGTLSECSHTLTASGKLHGQRLTVKDGSIRAAMLGDPALARLNHKGIAYRLGMTPRNVVRTCQVLIADGTLSECPHILKEDGSVDKRAAVVRRESASRPKPPRQVAKSPIPGAVSAARTLLLEHPDLATRSHEAISGLLGIPRYNVQRACLDLRREGLLDECRHAATTRRMTSK